MPSKHILVALLIVMIILIIIILIHSPKEHIETPNLPSPLYTPIPTPPVNNQRTMRIRIRRFRENPPEIINKPTKNKEHPEQYFNSIQEHDNDSQNAHNPQIITSLTKKYKRLMELYKQDESQITELVNAGISLEEIKESKIKENIMQIKLFSDKYFGSDDKKQKVNNVLNEMSKNNTITSVSYEFQDGAPIPVKENWILSLIWERIHHPDNQTNTKGLEIALIDQLVDCVQKNNDIIDLVMQTLFTSTEHEHEHLVCINGRVARIISSLSLLDKDPILSEPEKDEKEIANLAYMKASNILQGELKNQNMNELYIKNPDTLNKEETIKLEKFEKYVKEQIEEILLKEFKDTISIESLKEIIKKEQEGV